MSKQRVICSHCGNYERIVSMCDCDIESGAFLRDICEESVTEHASFTCPKCYNWNGHNYRFCRRIANALDKWEANHE